MLISFCGCDGSGKSTQVKRIKNWLENQQYEVKVIDKWDILDKEKFPECRFLDTTLEDLRVCIAEMEGISSALFLYWAISLTLTKDELNSRNYVYILDGYWMKHAASEIEYGCDSDWVEKTVEQFPTSDMTFYFDVDPEIAYERKDDVTPYECGKDMSLSKNSFLKHQSNVRSRMKQWAEKKEWVSISSHQEMDTITESVKENINSFIKTEKYEETT